MTNESQTRMQYLGVLGFLCEHSVYLGRDQEAMATIARILDDAKQVIPELRWRRVLDRFYIDFV